MNPQRIEEIFTYAYPIAGMYALLHKQVFEENYDWNTFSHTANVSTPKTTFIPAPNNDTTYSKAWLDLRNGPVIIETPDTDDRYYSIQMLDMTSETIGNFGKRLYGTNAHRFAFADMNWQGEVPKDMILIRCQTSIVLAFLRILINSSNDIPTIKNLQHQFLVYPLHDANTKSAQREFPNLVTAFDSHWFQMVYDILNMMSFSAFDKQEKQDLLTIGQTHDPNLNQICDFQLQKIEDAGKQFGENDHYWRIARKGIGTYGKDFLQRAVVWHKGALANVPDESLYPSVFQDAQGELLDGQFAYILKFDEVPPVSQFWSLTMYRFDNAMLVDNPIDRYSIGDRSKHLVYSEDGSLTFYLSHIPPANDTYNWLPSPFAPFYLTLRLYGPSTSILQGEWHPPYIEKVGKKHE